MNAISAWLFPLVPRSRVAILRTVLYLFIWVDVLYTTSWVADHADVPGGLYQPLFLGRWLELPIPGPVFIPVLKWALLACALLAATNRLPRLLGATVFVLYLEWMIIAFSYGKVDHDRFAFLVALAVLPTAGAARWRDHAADDRAGFAIRCIQVAVVATYFLAAFAKLRYGGPEWVNGATLLRAVVRRGTWLTDPLIDNPEILHVAQYFVIGFELLSPLMLVPGRVGRVMLASAFVFHAVTFATITIIFLPHVMCLLAFLPLERLTGAPRAGLEPAPERPPERVGTPVAVT